MYICAVEFNFLSLICKVRNLEFPFLVDNEVLDKTFDDQGFRHGATNPYR